MSDKQNNMKLFEEYSVELDGLRVGIKIVDRKEVFVKEYLLGFPSYGKGTQALLDTIKQTLISESTIEADKLIDPKFINELKDKFSESAQKILERSLPNLKPKEKKALIGSLMHEMLGLGKIELLLADGNLEEIVVNESREPVWVYHKGYGWLETNVFIESEEDIQNYASIIARRVGKQITTLDPLLDAHLTSGDRVNATLEPISNEGNTLTIRRFRRRPWTVVDIIENQTINSELMALLWEALQYELNIIFSGGTASGKTTMMGICLPFIPPNNRVLSIEDTRELKAPDFLHWVPMVTREPNPEGKGKVEMLDLLVNALRMRPDRIIVGEIRRQAEAEVMFEGMHTGHSVYTTVHANTAEETVRRLTNPPINTPVSMLDTVHLNVVMFRNRRLGVRRVLEVAEFILQKGSESKDERVEVNTLYRWRGSDDKIIKNNESIKLMDDFVLHTGLTRQDILDDLVEKKKVLEWMIKQDMRDVNDVGRAVAQYYKDKKPVMDAVKNNKALEV
jgi:archaeal flagellar protein FlaI